VRDVSGKAVRIPNLGLDFEGPVVRFSPRSGATVDFRYRRRTDGLAVLIAAQTATSDFVANEVVESENGVRVAIGRSEHDLVADWQLDGLRYSMILADSSDTPNTRALILKAADSIAHD